MVVAADTASALSAGGTVRYGNDCVSDRGSSDNIVSKLWLRTQYLWNNRGASRWSAYDLPCGTQGASLLVTLKSFAKGKSRWSDVEVSNSDCFADDMSNSDNWLEREKHRPTEHPIRASIGGGVNIFENYYFV
jgi:hypothetical protein